LASQNAKGLDESSLANQVHRIGHHIRQVIVEEAKASIDDMPHLAGAVTGAGPEPIPESQSAYHAQVDAAIRDLFPRIPNTDRQMIIEHSFTRVCIFSFLSPPFPVTQKDQMANNNIFLRDQLIDLSILSASQKTFHFLAESSWQSLPT
jgi:hypothetical protein